MQFASLAFFPQEVCGFALIDSRAAFAVSALAFVIIHGENIVEKEFNSTPRFYKSFLC